MNSDAAADIIAVIALIAVFVTGAAIVSVALLSTLPGDAAPAMIARNATDGRKLYIYHEGGDPLERGHFEILVDGVRQTGNVALINASGYESRDWTSWKAGEALNLTDVIRGLPEDAYIQIAGEGVGRAGSDWLLHEIGRGTPVTTTPTPTPTDPPDVDFTANITEGNAPLTVQFTGLSASNPDGWHWDFGDGNDSYDQSPIHTYESPGNYTVSLTATNTGGSNTETKTNFIRVTEEAFIDFIIEENVFVYGNALALSGDNVDGPEATIIITGDLNTANTNLGASINVSYIYIDGDVNINSGSASLGSSTNPGRICINGNLKIGTGNRSIYGEVYVNGNCDLEGVWLHGNMSVNGDLTLRREDTGLEDYARIYYTGALTSFNNVNDSTLEKCIKQETVQGFTMPEQEIPLTKPDSWYMERDYVSSGNLTSNMKIFADSYTSSGSATNVVIIASDGDISITGWGNKVTGVFFAPNGKVTFSGDSLEGVVIARDGFHVTSYGSTVTFKNIEEYITDPENYPF
ncbi:MAG: PKD domain-containing protein [Methanomicrobiales archaeon]|mgnify:CR=1 FL=1|nr:PKD domain-containing protein [Methanomicrobiales archaeon]